MTQRLIITGGAGAVASLIRPLLARPGREIVLLDIVEPAVPAGDGEEFVLATVTDIDALVSVFTGADLVVHLGGYASERPWEDILEVNINGSYCVLEAAHRAGVNRAVLASSIHAVGYATAGEARDLNEIPPRPDTYYGVGKATMEALGRLYADRFGMTVVSARMGTAEVRPSSSRSLSTWVSPSDIARLVEAVFDRTEAGGHVVWGVSANTRRWICPDAGHIIGFVPMDDAEVFAKELGDSSGLSADSRLFGAFTDENHPLGGRW